MSKALRYRLFGIGKMPPDWRQAALGPGVLAAAEGISVKESVQALRMPRTNVSQGTKLLVGSLVVRPDRLLASVGEHTIIDTDLRSSHEGGSTLTLAPDGVHIAFDVASVLPGGSGAIEVHFRLRLDAATLARLPSTACPVSLENAGPALLDGWKGSRAR